MNHIRGGTAQLRGGIVDDAQFNTTYRAFSYGTPSEGIGVRLTLVGDREVQWRTFARFVMPRIGEPEQASEFSGDPGRRRLRVSRERTRENVRRRPPKKLP